MQLLQEIRYQARGIVREFGFFQKSYTDSAATHAETHTLIELERLGGLEVGELARVLRVDKSVSSRIFKSLLKKQWVQLKKTSDLRKKIYILTSSGKAEFRKIEKTANKKTAAALNELSSEEQQHVLQGLKLFAKALKISRVKDEYKIRVIESADDAKLACIVRKTLKEMGFEGPGTAATDPTLDHLSEHFVGTNKIYYVIERNGQIFGGAGITPLVGARNDTCELIRMFLAPDIRGSGLGQALMDLCIGQARKFGYKKCYLETTEIMEAAQRLYLHNGFKYLKKKKGNTGHFACTVMMEKKL